MRVVESERIGHGVAILLACVFVAMVGFGITMPVLPFYTERLIATEAARRLSIAMHVSLLTSTYALTQLLFAPVWGRWSDKVGRRRLALIGIAGSALTQVLFGISNSLWLLHAARVLGGALSSAVSPAASAYVADATTPAERTRGMAWLGTTSNLGVVAGLAVGGSLSRRDLHFKFRYGHLMVDSFSVPFFAAAMLMLLTLIVAWLWLPESMRADSARKSRQNGSDWRKLIQKLNLLLVLTVAGQLGLAVFEATFALYAQRKLGYGPFEVGIAFSVCALVMAVFQIVATGTLSRYVKQNRQIVGGFALMGTTLILLLLPRSIVLILIVIGLFALGMAFISISRHQFRLEAILIRELHWECRMPQTVSAKYLGHCWARPC